MSICLTGAVVNDNYLYSTPATGATVAPNDRKSFIIINPAAGIAALTITMPPNPHDGHLIWVWFSQNVTTLTINGNTGQTIANGAPATINAGQGFRAIYNMSNTTWYIVV